MSTILRVVVATGCLILWLRPAEAQQAGAGLSVDKVVSLVRARLSEDLIVSMIRKEGKAFNLSADDMITLKKAGATDAVIRAMLDPRATPGSATAGAGASSTSRSQDASPGPIKGRYGRGGGSTGEVLEFRGDGTLLIRSGRDSYAGTYRVEGQQVVLTVNDRMVALRFDGKTITSLDGTMYSLLTDVVQGLPFEPGLYYVASDGEFIRISETKPAEEKARGKATWLTGGIAPLRLVAYYAGPTAQTRISMPRPTFYYVREVDMQYPTAKPEDMPEQLVLFEVKNGRREIQFGQASGYLGFKGISIRYPTDRTRPLELTKLTPVVYKIVPVQDLPSGEYLLSVEYGGTRFDFGITHR